MRAPAVVLPYLLRVPPVEWYGAVDGLRAQAAERDIQELDALIEKAARAREYLREYLNYGHGEDDRAHRAGVRAANRIATKIRRALGYSYPKQEITF